MGVAAPQLTLDPVDWTAWADDPYPLYRLMRDEAPVFRDESNDTYILTRYADVYEVQDSFPDLTDARMRIIMNRTNRAEPPEAGAKLEEIRAARGEIVRSLMEAGGASRATT
jgi:cytochrome P450